VGGDSIVIVIGNSGNGEGGRGYDDTLVVIDALRIFLSETVNCGRGILVLIFFARGNDRGTEEVYY
jgi:hypothetical protein